MSVPGIRSIERRFVLLTALRWIPVGVLIPVSVLVALDRGLTLAQVGIAFSVQGIVVLVLELPSGGLADAWGRRPVLIVASCASLASVGLLFFAQSFTAFLAVYGLQGLFRALDSGALEAWFADAVLAVDPSARLERGLSTAGVALGVGVGGGAIASTGLILAAPMLRLDSLSLPVGAAALLCAVQLFTLSLVLKEVRPARVRVGLIPALRAIPRELANGIRLLSTSRVLLAIVAVELFWGFGMIAFEMLTPVRLGEVLGSREAAAALMGPVTAAAWLAFALGSGLTGRLSRRFGVAALAAVFRVAQGVTVVALGLVAGPVGVVTAFLACYAVHGVSNPLHNTLLHREASGSNRAMVLSLNSMVGQPAGSIGAIALGAIAGGVSVSAAMIVGGIVLAVAAPLYLPAWRAERTDEP